MRCVNCDKIRSAFLHGRMAEAAGLTIEAFREKFGLSADDEQKPEVAIDEADKTAPAKARR